jgi:hypothetical protein
MTEEIEEVEAVPNPLAELMSPPTLTMAADVLDDMERVRIANQNRLRQLVLPRMNKDGKDVGFGFLPPNIHVPEDEEDFDLVQAVLDEVETHLSIQAAANRKIFTMPKGWNPMVWQMGLIVPPMQRAEVNATKNLQKTIQDHPLYGWIEAQKGLGAKQVGRLLAAIGDPYWNVKMGRPRTIAELWSYSGYSVIAGLAPARRKGTKVNWSVTARMRCRMISESCMKSGGPYREVYDQEKEFYADAVHELACVRCGPSGSPALAGTPLSKNHIHARALRCVSKEVLRDLWRQSRAIHVAHGFGPPDLQDAA